MKSFMFSYKYFVTLFTTRSFPTPDEVRVRIRHISIHWVNNHLCGCKAETPNPHTSHTEQGRVFSCYSYCSCCSFVLLLSQQFRIGHFNSSVIANGPTIRAFHIGIKLNTRRRYFYLTSISVPLTTTITALKVEFAFSCCFTWVYYIHSFSSLNFPTYFVTQSYIIFPYLRSVLYSFSRNLLNGI